MNELKKNSDYLLDIQRATFNILEDFESEKEKLERFKQAILNLLDDFSEERERFKLVQKATLNLLEDVHVERESMSQAQRALMNILEDIETERTQVAHSKTLLEMVNKELEAFSYSVSHDLQAPLRAISGFAQAVVEDYAPKLDAEGQRYLKLIQTNAHNMGRLIQDLLTFSRLGRQQMGMTEIQMQYMVKNVIEELKFQMADRNIQFEVKPLPNAWGDPAMIHQVLINLISNALKFTRPRNSARIEIGFQREGEKGVYYIKDNGVGFDMQYSDKLFGVFQRLHSVEEFEGTGVGLALVKRIISRHGGQIWAQSAVDQGTTFFFDLPEGAKNDRNRS